MIEDPQTTWPGRFPYRVLADVGITPSSTQADIEDAAFTLMTEDMMNPAAQQAWRRLRDVRGRLLVDLLLYDLDQDADIARLLEQVTGELAAEPATIPDELLAGQPVEPPAVPDDLCAFPTRSFIDGLIQFDR